MIKFKELLEKSGAGDWGTDEATKTLKMGTPGQKITDIGLKNKERIEEALQHVHTITYDGNAPSDPKPFEVAEIKNDFKLHVQAIRGAIKKLGGLITDTEVPSRQNKFVGKIKIGTRGDASKISIPVIQRGVKSGGIELHKSQFESLQEERMDAIGALEKLVKRGGIDKADFQKAHDLYKAAKLNDLKRHIKKLDTDAAEAIADIIQRHDSRSFNSMYPRAKSGDYLAKIIREAEDQKTFAIKVPRGGPQGRDYVTKVSGKDKEDAVKQWRKRNPKFKNDKIDVKQLATLKRKGDRYSFSESLEEGAVSVSTVEKEIRSNGGSKIRKTDNSMEFMYRGATHTIPLDRGFVRDTDYMKLQKYFGG